MRCSKGFFVRSLAAELGEALGCGAHLAALRRTHSGPFSLADAVPLTAILEAPQSAGPRVLSMERALADLQAVTVSALDAVRVRHGGAVEVAPSVQGTVRVLGPGGELLAVADALAGCLVYRRVLGGWC